jgi:hypothetical protein
MGQHMLAQPGTAAPRRFRASRTVRQHLVAQTAQGPELGRVMAQFPNGVVQLGLDIRLVRLCHIGAEGRGGKEGLVDVGFNGSLWWRLTIVAPACTTSDTGGVGFRCRKLPAPKGRYSAGPREGCSVTVVEFRPVRAQSVLWTQFSGRYPGVTNRRAFGAE